MEGKREREIPVVKRSSASSSKNKKERKKFRKWKRSTTKNDASGHWRILSFSCVCWLLRDIFRFFAPIGGRCIYNITEISGECISFPDGGSSERGREKHVKRRRYKRDSYSFFLSLERLASTASAEKERESSESDITSLTVKRTWWRKAEALLLLPLLVIFNVFLSSSFEPNAGHKWHMLPAFSFFQKFFFFYFIFRVILYCCELLGLWFLRKSLRDGRHVGRSVNLFSWTRRRYRRNAVRGQAMSQTDRNFVNVTIRPWHVKYRSRR